MKLIMISVNLKSMKMFDLWDGTRLKCTFRGTFTDDLMAMRLDLESIGRSICFVDQEDSLVWQCESTGVHHALICYS